MAATAQDSTVPLRGGDGKVKEDDLEDGTPLHNRSKVYHGCSVCWWGCCCVQLVICADQYTCSAVEYSPFYGIEKGAVLQEARIFHQSNLEPRKCQQVLPSLDGVKNCQDSARHV